jgi:CO/xanthine dehydrogenase FAD-binding subunit
VARLESGSGLRRGEIITKISIPTHNWNFGEYRKIHTASGSGKKIVFSAVARVEKGVLVEWCLALATGEGAVVRDRELEIAVAGKPLPLTSKELNSVEESIGETAAGAGLDEYGRLVTGNLSRAFLRRAAG